MPRDAHKPPNAEESKRWFQPNRVGLGWHPSSWQGWLILVGGVAVIVTVVVLLQTGVL